MRNYYSRSAHKFEAHVLNEDAAMATRGCLAVSDGAGGGGVFAERWSRYLLKRLPRHPITTFKELDDWIDAIWEPFYNECEVEAKKRGGLFLEKFYDEGSFATLAAAWKTGGDEWRWMTYGDSVVFHYDRGTGILQHSPIRLADFDKPPCLISDKDPLKEEGFHTGGFSVGDGSVVFVASDALAHYVMMMYELERKEEYGDELAEAVRAKTKNSNFVLAAQNVSFSFDGVLDHLLDPSKDYRAKLRKLEKDGLLGHDDYSIAVYARPGGGTT